MAVGLGEAPREALGEAGAVRKASSSPSPSLELRESAPVPTLARLALPCAESDVPRTRPLLWGAVAKPRGSTVSAGAAAYGAGLAMEMEME